jgi:esterase/lipase
MKFQFLIFSLLLTSISYAFDTGLNLGNKNYNIKISEEFTLSAAVYNENSKFKSCALFIPGYADSFRNHLPLINSLNDNGYKVITFNFSGHDGSSGDSANFNFSWSDERFDSLEQKAAHSTSENSILYQAQYIWDKLAGDQNCSKEDRILIGFSAGGLAAYKMAILGWSNKVVLINPVLQAKSILNSLRPGGTFQSIKELNEARSLSFPSSAIAGANKGTLNLIQQILVESELLGNILPSKNLKGAIFYSENDIYSDSEKVEDLLISKAPHQFELHKYPNSRHRLDQPGEEVDYSFDDQQAQLPIDFKLWSQRDIERLLLNINHFLDQ